MKLQQKQSNDGTKKKKTTPAASTPRVHEEECPVCLDTLPVDTRTLTRMTCCGKAMHKSCAKDIETSTMTDKQKWSCPLCRTQAPRTEKEELKQIRTWVEK